MTGRVCPECGVHRPGCACARAELAAAEDFDPLRIRPYVTLGSAEDAGADAGAEARGAGAGTYGAGAYGSGAYGSGAGKYGAEAYGAGGADADPPTARLAAIRPGSSPQEHPYEDVTGPVPYAGAGGDPSETMSLLLRGPGEVPPPHGGDRPRGRRRGTVIAAVAAVAVAGTAALAAAALGGGGGTDDRAAVPEVTTSASLDLAVPEEPTPSSGSPEPTSSSPTPRRTSASPSASPSATASPSTSASASASGTPGASASPGASTGPAAPPSVTASASPTDAPSATSARPSRSPEATEEPEQALTLSYGDEGPEVEDLQWRLRAAWVYFGPIDGHYGNKVREAVREFQRWRSIEGDPLGVYGPSTRAVLEGEQSGN
ncbi:peptidoglycan-binding protein [Streptomyces sp. cmx-4-7]|uniref:peptidoglycan-binding domain-containing protein n=1 Tax=Streptomyces sp. cmx-4-7 TaxID=2790939 RepID=UPI00397FBBE5